MTARLHQLYSEIRGMVWLSGADGGGRPQTPDIPSERERYRPYSRAPSVRISRRRARGQQSYSDRGNVLSTTIACDIIRRALPTFGFFHADTRFLSRLELRVDGYRTVVLSSSTEQTFASQD